MSRRTQAPRILALILLAGLWLLTVVLFDALPAVIPIHFDIRGHADGYAGRQAFWWLPSLATALAILFALGLPNLITWLARRHPAWLNVPAKQRFLTLHQEARSRVIAPMCDMLAILSCELLALFGYLIFGISQVASGEWSSLPVWPLFLWFGFMLATVAVSWRMGQRATRAELGA